MFLDITKKPGDPDAVKTLEMIMMENDLMLKQVNQLRLENETMTKEVARLADRNKKLESDNETLKKENKTLRARLMPDDPDFDITPLVDED